MSPTRIHVVAGVLKRGSQFFIQQRQPGKHMAGYWEFPGGKVEPNESPWDALVRELHEELGIHSQRGEPLVQLCHSYPDREIFLDVWTVQAWSPEPVAQEQQVAGWYSLSDMRDLPMLPADGPILQAMAELD